MKNINLAICSLIKVTLKSGIFPLYVFSLWEEDCDQLELGIQSNTRVKIDVQVIPHIYAQPKCDPNS
jgi:hypothetical protein